MLKRLIFSLLVFTIFLMVLVFVSLGFTQDDLAQQAYAIFERNCLNCHGEHGAFTEEIIIEHTALIETGAVVPRRPGASELYKRLIEKRIEKRMPLGQPPLSPAAINTIRRWIQAGAPDWEPSGQDGAFITPKEVLETIEKHVNSLAPSDRAFARYFTLTHLYNAGETIEALHGYQRALSKLVNSLSWGRDIKKPEPIDPAETIFYIDLRDYEWDIPGDTWTQIEQVYPYSIEFNSPTQTNLREKLTNLREEMDCEVPFVQVDWFLATASLPPFYNDILGLPETDAELEARLEVNVVENLRNAAGRRVWRAGFNDSGVSNHNRVVERHTSRYGAYWKSYDFAGSVGTQNIFTHPLSFRHDGGEIIFNLPNGLQAYFLVDAGGNRLDEAPINIVRNLAASDPTVRNGLSCIGCHTEGMKAFKDQVRPVIQKAVNPNFNKVRALQLYTKKATMDALVDEDTQRYKQALEEAGGVFGGIEPVQRFYEAFQRPLDASHAAASIGLETEAFIEKIGENSGLQNFGLLGLENGTMKRDTWTDQFSEIVFLLDFPDERPSDDDQEEIIPGEDVYIPDPNLRIAIAEALGKSPNASITAEDMATLTRLVANNKGISDLTGLQFATDLETVELRDNSISDLSPFAELTKIWLLGISDNQISDLSPLSGLINLRHLSIYHNPEIADLSPLKGLTNLDYLSFVGSGKISDISALAGLINLKQFTMWGSPISDLSPLAGLTNLEILDICGSKASDISVLPKLTGLKELYLAENGISDVSPLRHLTGLTRLSVKGNEVSDVSPLASLRNLKWLALHKNSISDLSPLDALSKATKILWHENPGFPKGGPKIEGPWLWVMVPGDRLDESTDLLAQASRGMVTEKKIATQGAIEGNSIGESVWQSHAIAPTGDGNINEMLRALGIEPPTHPDYVVYGSVALYSPRKQNTTMYAGSNDNHKIWLNSKLVHEKLNGVWAHDYQDFFPVTLKQGTNVLLVAIDNSGGWNWTGYFGFEEGTDYTLSSPRIRYTFSEATIHVGDAFTLDISAENIHDLAGWQFDIAFDPSVLEAIKISESDFLKLRGGTTFFQKGRIDNATGKITKLSSARLSEDGVSGTGTLLSVTFTAKADGQTQVRLENFQLAAITGVPIAAGPHEVVITVEGQLATGDVNRDGQVSILDMVLVARQFGETVPANSGVDVNGDGVISILDLILVASHLGESTASASSSILAVDGIHGLDPAMIQAWIERAQIEDDGSIAFQQGIARLQQLLASLIPEKTALLANYPNPFNPETWIPYQLAVGGEVQISIYDVKGSLVRQLDLGHQSAGMYQSRVRAAYWAGTNDMGEKVASGIYFYTLTAGDFSDTRKMLILK